MKPTWVVIKIEIDGHTRRHSYAIVLTCRHCPVCVVANAKYRVLVDEFRPQWADYKTTVCSLQLQSINQSINQSNITFLPKCINDRFHIVTISVDNLTCAWKLTENSQFSLAHGTTLQTYHCWRRCCFIDKFNNTWTLFFSVPASALSICNVFSD